MKRTLFFLILTLGLRGSGAAAADNAAGGGTHIFLDASTPGQMILQLRWSDKVTLDASYLSAEKELNVTAQMQNVDLKDLAPFLKNSPLKTALIKKGEVKLTKQKEAVVEANVKIENIAFILPPQPTRWTPDKKSIEFKGNIELAAKLAVTKPAAGAPVTNYSLNGAATGGQLYNLPLIDTLSQIEAEFSMDKEKLTLVRLDADMASGQNAPAHIQAKGEITLKENPALLLQAETTISAGQLIRIIETAKAGHLNLDADADIALRGTVTGALKQKKFDAAVDYRITNGRWQELKDIQAEGFFQPDKLIVQKAKLNYKNLPLEISGKIENFSSPQIELTAGSGFLDVTAKADYRRKDKEINVTELTIKGEKTNIISKAYIALAQKPQIKIEGFGSVHSTDAAKLIQAFNLNYPLWQKLNPQGEINAKFNITGALNPAEWELKLAGASKKLCIYNILGENLKFELYKNKNELTISPLLAQVGGGELEMRAQIDYLNDTVIINAGAGNIDLAEIRKQLQLKNKDLAGKMFLEVYLRNNSLKTWDKLTGEGKALIRDGRLWQINLLKGLGELLFLPDFEEITFDQGYTDLAFKEKYILLENLELSAVQLKLKGTGSIATDSNINFELLPEINPNLISASHGLKEILSSFIGKSGIAIQIKGTLKEPKYNLKPTIPAVLQGLPGLIKGLLE